MGPRGSGAVETARQASWICCFHAEDSLDPVARTRSRGSPGEPPFTGVAGAAAIVEVGGVQLAAELRIEALRPDPPGNWEQVVVKVAASAGQGPHPLEADGQFKGDMPAADRDRRTDQRLDLIKVGA